MNALADSVEKLCAVLAHMNETLLKRAGAQPTVVDSANTPAPSE